MRKHDPPLDRPTLTTSHCPSASIRPQKHRFPQKSFDAKFGNHHKSSKTTCSTGGKYSWSDKLEKHSPAAKTQDQKPNQPMHSAKSRLKNLVITEKNRAPNVPDL
jgi:hypothetical protein